MTSQYLASAIRIDSIATDVLDCEGINQGFDLMRAGTSSRSVVIY